jgi:hypothetical protein
MGSALVLSSTIAQRMAFLYPDGQVPGLAHAPALDLDVDGVLDSPAWRARSLPNQALPGPPPARLSDQAVCVPVYVLKQLHLTQGAWVLVSRAPHQRQEHDGRVATQHRPDTQMVVAQVRTCARACTWAVSR